jgi:hypothetical protein
MRLFKRTHKYFISGTAICTHNPSAADAVSGPSDPPVEIREEFTAILTLGPLDNNVVNGVRSFLARELGKQNAAQTITNVIINTISLVK